MSKPRGTVLALIIWALVSLDAKAQGLEGLTPEEATRPWEEWTLEQILEKGWTPYNCGDAAEKGLDGRRWPRNDPGPPRLGTCVYYSFMVLPVLMDIGVNSWPAGMPAGSAAEVTAATATWAAAADIHWFPVGDGGGNWNAPGPPGLTGDVRVGSHSIDGVGGDIAHGYFPPPNLVSAAGDVHFDDAEAWVIAGPAGGPPYDVQTTALHELGHALGLTHVGTVAGDVMWGAYTGVKRALNPPPGGTDVANIQLIYGPPPHAAECQAVGACLSPQGRCLGVMTEQECDMLGGQWQGEDTWCAAQAPVLTEWGLLILTAFIMIGAWICLRGRREAASFE